MGHRQIEEMLAIRKKHGPAMAVVARYIDFRDLYRCPAGRRYFVKRSLVRGRKDDDPFPVPGTPAALRSFTEGGCRAAANIYEFQLTVAEEAEDSSIGRPKWERRAHGSCNWAGAICPQLAHPQHMFTVCVIRHERDRTSIRRDHHGASNVSIEGK